MCMVWTGMHHRDGTYNFSLFIVICCLQNTSTIPDFNQNSRFCVTLQRQNYYIRNTMVNTDDTAHGAYVRTKNRIAWQSVRWLREGTNAIRSSHISSI